MYSSDSPYSVQLFVQPIRFFLQFLFTLFLIVSVFIVQTLLRPAHSVSSGMNFISRKVRRISEHKFASLAHYRTRYWNTCLPSLRSAALTTWYWSDRSHRLAAQWLDAARRLLLLSVIMCNQVRRFDPLCACTPWHHTEPSLQPCHSQTLHSPLPPLMQAFGTIYLNTFRVC